MVENGSMIPAVARLLEIANKVGVSKEMLRRPLKVLEEKRLIRSFQVAKSKVYRRIFTRCG